MEITKISQQKKNPNRVNIFIDGEYRFAAAKKFLIDFDLFKGQTISEKTIVEIFRKDVGEKLKDKIYRLVLSRPRSEKEVRDYIRKKFYEGKYKVEKEYWTELTVSIVVDLKELGLINDIDFTRWFVDNRKEFKPRGKHLLRMELKQKGIDDEIIKTHLDFSKDEEVELARRLVGKKVKTLMRFDEKKRKEKIIAFLQRKGFGWGIIQEVVEV